MSTAKPPRTSHSAIGAAVGMLTIGALVYLGFVWLDDGSALRGGVPVSQPRQTGDRPKDEAGFRPAAAPPPQAPTPLSHAPPPIVPLERQTAANVAVPMLGTKPDAQGGITVFGRLCDAAGTPTRERFESLVFDDGRMQCLSPDHTGDDYVMAGLAPGPWHAEWKAAGHPAVGVDVDLAADVGLVQLDLVLAQAPHWSLDIAALTPDGEPLGTAAARVLPSLFGEGGPGFAAIPAPASPDADFPEPGSPVDDGAHRWAFVRTVVYGTAVRVDSFGKPVGERDQSGALGTLHADGTLPPFVSLVYDTLVVQTQRVEEGASAVTFKVPVSALVALPGGVRVSVVGADTPAAPPQLIGALAGVELASSGSFTWQGLPPGSRTLTLRAPGYECWEGEVCVPVGGIADLGTVALTPATRLAGMVEATGVDPVGAQVRAIRDDFQDVPASAFSPGDGASATSFVQRDGRFEFVGLGRHRYRVTLAATSCAALPAVADLRQGPVDDVKLLVTPGALVRLRARWPTELRCDVQLTTADGTLVAAWKRWSGDASWTGRLPRGALAVSLLRDGRELRRIPFTVTDGELVVELSP